MISIFYCYELYICNAYKIPTYSYINIFFMCIWKYSRTLLVCHRVQQTTLDCACLLSCSTLLNTS